jgi:hypothetical protein
MTREVGSDVARQMYSPRPIRVDVAENGRIANLIEGLPSLRDDTLEKIRICVD